MPGFCTSAPAAPENSVAQRTRAMAPRPFMVAAAVANVVPGGREGGAGPGCMDEKVWGLYRTRKTRLPRHRLP